jgi:hypothetical protein
MPPDWKDLTEAERAVLPRLWEHGRARGPHRGPRSLWRCFPILLAALSLAGCFSRKVVNRPTTPTEDRLYKIGKAYQRASSRLNRAPVDFEELQPDLEPGDSEDLLRSPNDGEPFVILWGVDYRTLPPNPKSPHTVAAYEQRGTNGKRYVLRFPLEVAHLSNEELGKAVFPPGHSPPN